MSHDLVEDVRRDPRKCLCVVVATAVTTKVSSRLTNLQSAVKGEVSFVSCASFTGLNNNVNNNVNTEPPFPFSTLQDAKISSRKDVGGKAGVEVKPYANPEVKVDDESTNKLVLPKGDFCR